MPDPNDNQKPADDVGPDAEAPELPTTEELAAELTQIEGDDPIVPETGTDAEPAVDPQAPEAPADQPADAEAPGSDQEAPGGDQEDEDVKPKPRTQRPAIAQPSKTQAEKKTADAGRRKERIDEAEALQIPLSEQDEEEQARKDAIREQMAEVAEDRDDAQAHVKKCQALLRELSGRLYPHAVKSDHIVKAVKGYTESQKRLRAHRATEPARLKALLEQAGKAPIDAAFQRQRARGAGRPTRPRAKPAKTADQGGGSKANAGQE